MFQSVDERAELPETRAERVHPASLEPSALKAACELQFQRRSGPGGQHRNKVETAVRLRHRETGITVMASERRQQRANLDVALVRLRLQLALEVRHPWHQPTPLWRCRCSSGRISVRARHVDFPAMLAEALDVLEQNGWQVRPSAEKLGCSSSQLLRLVRAHPPAWQLMARQRRAQGLSPLH
jgi:hypothetical protein